MERMRRDILLTLSRIVIEVIETLPFKKSLDFLVACSDACWVVDHKTQCLDALCGEIG